MADISKLPKWAQAHIVDLEARNQALALAILKKFPTKMPEGHMPDLPPPDFSFRSGGKFGDMTYGWDINPSYALNRIWGIGGAVTKACSSSVHHGRDWSKTTTQKSRTLYSTERRAWLALRAAVIIETGKTLASIDERILAAKDETYLQNPNQ